MLYLIDASVYVFRAWFSLPDDMVDGEGNPVNALYGFARFLSDFLEEVRPEFIAVAFDESLASSFRNDIYPAYKANRDPAPPELERQFRQCRAFTRALGIAECASAEYEADDLIGTLVLDARQRGLPSTIVSRDKDLAQLLAAGDTLWDYAARRRLGYEQIPEAYGVWPEQIADFLALAGDAVDNIPGVPGVGKKTAAALLGHFGSLDVIYANLDSVCDVPVRGAGKLGARLEEHRDAAMLARQLTAIACDAPITFHSGETRWQGPDLEALHVVCDEADFGTALRRQCERIAAAR